MANDWNRLGRHVVSDDSKGSFKRRLDQSMDRDDRWDSEILDYFKGGGQGAVSCRSLTGLLQSHQFLYIGPLQASKSTNFMQPSTSHSPPPAFPCLTLG